MPRARANGIELEYETFGDAGGDPLLLVMGLGAQMILWDEEFCEELARRGYRVIRYDNRDVGLSTKLDHLGTPNILDLMLRAQRGEALDVPYRLSDMADDAAGLLDALDVGRAHVVGASMGGMIAQQLAIQHSERVASLVSIMSTTGNPELPRGKPDAMQALMRAPATDRASAIEGSVETFKVLSGSGYPLDLERIRERAARAYDRCFHPPGMARQLAAIMGSGSRREALAAVAAPTLVIHGREDPLVPVEGGIDTHEAIPGSELLLIDGMGHDLPVPAWPRIIEGIARVAQAGE